MNPGKREKNPSVKNILDQIKGAFGSIADKAYERKMRRQHGSIVDRSFATIPLYYGFA